MKSRLLFYKLIDFIENDMDYHIALIGGIRRTGKTTLLKQLKQQYGDEAEYFDLSRPENDLERIEDLFLDNPRKLLLLDEITYLDDYEMISQMLYNSEETGTHRMYKVIMTGSSSAHVEKLSNSKLGCRARLFRLPLLTFVEYLYFSDKIPSYENYNSVTNADFADYLKLSGLAGPASGLAITFDAQYFKAFYGETIFSNKKSRLTYSLVDLNEDDLTNLVNIMAYKLNEACGYKETIEPRIGGQEHIHLYNQQIKTKMSKIDLSTTIIADSVKAVPGITCEDIGRILYFLLWSGIAAIEHTRTALDVSPRGAASILEAVKRCGSEVDFESLFKEVSICLISPLYYTRIGRDILQQMNVPVEKLYKGMLFGKMLELYLRGAFAIRQAKPVLVTHKLKVTGIGDVDIWDNHNRILCEISSGDKRFNEIHVHKFFREHEFIRVCSSKNKDFFDEKRGYYQIPYARLCCMIDTGDIFKQNKTRTALTAYTT